jgi:hypothetical protein
MLSPRKVRGSTPSELLRLSRVRPGIVHKSVVGSALPRVIWRSCDVVHAGRLASSTSYFWSTVVARIATVASILLRTGTDTVNSSLVPVR